MGLQEKYELNPEDAGPLAEFLAPMLQYHAERRATAEQVLQHPWLPSDAVEPAPES